MVEANVINGHAVLWPYLQNVITLILPSNSKPYEKALILNLKQSHSAWHYLADDGNELVTETGA